MERMREGIVFGGMFDTMMLIPLITSRSFTHSSLFSIFFYNQLDHSKKPEFALPNSSINMPLKEGSRKAKLGPTASKRLAQIPKLPAYSNKEDSQRGEHSTEPPVR